MPLKRSRSTSSFRSRAKRARRTGSMYKGQIRLGSRAMTRIRDARLAQRVNNLYRMIETKEGSRSTSSNVGLGHNTITVMQDSIGGVLNPLRLTQGVDDAMATGGQRIGDQVTIKGLMIKGMVECALQRSKVFFRIMLLRGAKGETFDRTTIFKGASGNKMIDMVNTERFSIVAQKVFNVSCTNVAPASVGTTGVPASGTPAGQGTKIFKMWIPGYKFGRGGNVKYEEASLQPKFYDYRICVLVYDWFGTPEFPVNNVGIMNTLYTKLYYKDA